jgi:hypothetical protein
MGTLWCVCSHLVGLLETHQRHQLVPLTLPPRVHLRWINRLDQVRGNIRRAFWSSGRAATPRVLSSYTSNGQLFWASPSSYLSHRVKKKRLFPRHPAETTSSLDHVLFHILSEHRSESDNRKTVAYVFYLKFVLQPIEHDSTSKTFLFVMPQ